MIQAAIQILIADTPYKNAIGLNKAGTRRKVYPVVADKDEEPPFAVAYISSADPNSSTCHDEPVFELIHCSRPDETGGAYLKVHDLAEKARTALEAHSGVESTSGLDVKFFLINYKDGYDANNNLIQRISTYKTIWTR